MFRFQPINSFLVWTKSFAIKFQRQITFSSSGKSIVRSFFCSHLKSRTVTNFLHFVTWYKYILYNLIIQCGNLVWLKTKCNRISVLWSSLSTELLISLQICDVRRQWTNYTRNNWNDGPLFRPRRLDIHRTVVYHTAHQHCWIDACQCLTNDVPSSKLRWPVTYRGACRLCSSAGPTKVHWAGWRTILCWEALYE